MENAKIALLKNRQNLIIQILKSLVFKMNNCITHLSVLESQLFRFNFIIPADSTCQIDHSTTLLLQPLDIVIELQSSHPSYSVCRDTLIPYHDKWKDNNTIFKNNRQKTKEKTNNNNNNNNNNDNKSNIGSFKGN